MKVFFFYLSLEILDSPLMSPLERIRQMFILPFILVLASNVSLSNKPKVGIVVPFLLD